MGIFSLVSILLSVNTLDLNINKLIMKNLNFVKNVKNKKNQTH